MNQSTTIRNKVENFIAHLAKVTQTASLYGESHRLTMDTLHDMQSVLNEILSEQNEFTIGIIGDEIAFEKDQFFETSIRKKGFIDLLKEKQMNKISFSLGIDATELQAFITILAKKAKTENDDKTLDTIFKENNIKHITIGEIGFFKNEPHEQIEESLEVYTRKTFEEGVECLEKMAEGIKQHQPLDMNYLRHIVSGLVKSILINKNLLLMLTSIKLQDEDNFVRNLNVCVFTLLQAEMLGLEHKYLVDITISSLLHNIGDLVTSDKPKEKKDPKNQNDSVKQTTSDTLGAKLLIETESIGTLAPIVAFEYNIPYNDSGYPNKIYGEKLNLVSMMITISRRYDALRRDRTYFENGGTEKVYNEMMQYSGKDFHPDLLHNFFSAIGVYPPGTLVEIDNGEVGLVIQTSILDIRRPQIELLYNSKGEKYQEPVIINLLEKNNKGQYRWKITKSISPLEKFKIPDKFS
ncbi:HD-GYP domain-containing protein [bacterium]